MGKKKYNDLAKKIQQDVPEREFMAFCRAEQSGDDKVIYHICEAFGYVPIGFKEQYMEGKRHYEPLEEPQYTNAPYRAGSYSEI
jgi:hypothetical protein